MVLEKTLESPLDCKEIQPVHPKGAQSWVFIGRTDVEAETPVLWPPHVKSWLIWKDPDAGRDWGQEEKGTTGWDGITDSVTWVWANSGRFWRTRKPGMLQSMGSHRVGHNLMTKQQKSIGLMCLTINIFTFSISFNTHPKRASLPYRAVWVIFQNRNSLFLHKYLFSYNNGKESAQ